MSQGQIRLWVGIIILVGVPAYGYGDPSGGTLFQILMPTLAAIWAMWVILAHRVRRAIGSIFRKWRETEPEEPAA